jgi:hypothetical protein
MIPAVFLDHPDCFTYFHGTMVVTPNALDKRPSDSARLLRKQRK